MRNGEYNRKRGAEDIRVLARWFSFRVPRSTFRARQEMFTNQHHLRHLLRPDQYVSVEQHRAELRHVFQPAWHPLATIHDLAKPGDFLSFELFETPILMRNCDGEVCAFLNVCP
ncbi:MAG: hypothetical protein L0241_15990, partial [Planctomycetia bacterium]|nr:hypothetical protein [Planctomycetia bacterium]